MRVSHSPVSVYQLHALLSSLHWLSDSWVPPLKYWVRTFLLFTFLSCFLISKSPLPVGTVLILKSYDHFAIIIQRRHIILFRFFSQSFIFHTHLCSCLQENSPSVSVTCLYLYDAFTVLGSWKGSVMDRNMCCELLVDFSLRAQGWSHECVTWAVPQGLLACTCSPVTVLRFLMILEEGPYISLFHDFTGAMESSAFSLLTSPTVQTI